MSGWQPIEGFAYSRQADEEYCSDAAARVFLALRQCTTHPAGPLRTVADLRRAQLAGFTIVDVEHRVRSELEAADIPAERREVMDAFLDVVFAGLADLEERRR